MIVFLTLLYVGVLAVAIKMGLIKPTLFWKISPAIWMIVLFILLFLPMQWGAPSGNVNVYQPIIEIVPNVSGEVIDVPVKPLAPLESGDVLFQIDPVPFQATVDGLRAQLEAAKQDVERLDASAKAAAASVDTTKDEIEIQKSNVESAEAQVAVAENNLQQAESQRDKSLRFAEDLKGQLDAAKRELDRQRKLLAQNAGSASESDRAEAQYTNFLSQFNVAMSDARLAEQNVSGTRLTLEAEKANANAVRLRLDQLVQAELPRVTEVAREARLAADSMVGDEHTLVAKARAQLEAAEFDLEQTTVRAPAKGHVAFLSLRPGQRVASLPMRSWMAFIDHEKTEIVVSINQFALRHVRPGQDAEVTFKIYPGKVFKAKVNRIVDVNSSAQLQASGQIGALNHSDTAEPYGVILEIDDDAIDPMMLAGGASGSATIYTNSMQATHVIRRVMIRMDAWLNYIVP